MNESGDEDDRVLQRPLSSTMFGDSTTYMGVNNLSRVVLLWLLRYVSSGFV